MHMRLINDAACVPGKKREPNSKVRLITTVYNPLPRQPIRMLLISLFYSDVA